MAWPAAGLALERLPTLEAGRVVLRELTALDAADIFAVFSDPAVMRYWSREPMQAGSEALGLIEQMSAGRRDGTFYQWGIELLAASRIIGTVTLFCIDLAHRRAEVGFALGRAWWGRGLAREAVLRVADHAFDSMGLERLEADADPRNAASLALLGRLGFQREGLLRQRYRVAGEVQDSVMLGLLAGERPAR